MKYDKECQRELELLDDLTRSRRRGDEAATLKYLAKRRQRCIAELENRCFMQFAEDMPGNTDSNEAGVEVSIKDILGASYKGSGEIHWDNSTGFYSLCRQVADVDTQTCTGGAMTCIKEADPKHGCR